MLLTKPERCAPKSSKPLQRIPRFRADRLAVPQERMVEHHGGWGRNKRQHSMLKVRHSITLLVTRCIHHKHHQEKQAGVLKVIFSSASMRFERNNEHTHHTSHNELLLDILVGACLRIESPACEVAGSQRVIQLIYRYPFHSCSTPSAPAARAAVARA